MAVLAPRRWVRRGAGRGAWTPSSQRGSTWAWHRLARASRAARPGVGLASEPWGWWPRPDPHDGMLTGPRSAWERQGLGGQSQWSKPAGAGEAPVRARAWGRGWGWARPLHLVTRSASKALMPWAALSRASSLAGGPCQKTAPRRTPWCATHGVSTDSAPCPRPPAAAWPRAPGPRAAASTGRRRGGLLAGTGGWHTRPRHCYQAATVATSKGHTPGPYLRSRGRLAPSRSGGPDSDHWARDF